jgi:hypothetical protein
MNIAAPRSSGACLRRLTLVACCALAGCQHDNSSEPNRNYAQAELWRIDSIPQLVLRGGDTSKPEGFRGVVGAVRLTDGRVVIGDAASNTIKFFDAHGRLMTQVAQDTTGQDLFLRWVGRCPGTSLVAAKDIRLRRLSFFSESGTLVRAMRIPRWLVHTQVVRCQADGSVLTFQVIPLLIPKGRGLTRSRASLLRVHAESLRVDTLSTFPGTEYYYSHRSPLFAVEPLGAAAFASFGASVGYVGANDSNRIDVFDSAGVHATSFLIDVPQRGRARIGSVMTAVSTLLEEEPVAYARSLMRRVFEEAPLKTERPRYDQLATDIDEDVWVRLAEFPGDSTRRWALFAKSGQPLGAIDLPGNFFPADIGRNYILGVRRDLTTESESVALFRLFRAGVSSGDYR